MIIRLSQKLAGKIHQTMLPPLQPEPDMLADWYGHVFTFARRQYIIVINSATILTVVFPGNGIVNIDKFMQQFLVILADICRDIETMQLYDRIIASAGSSLRTARAVSKQVTGCMNEQIFMAAAILQSENISCFNLAKRLNENMQAYIHYLRPRQSFWGLVETQMKLKGVDPAAKVKKRLR